MDSRCDTRTDARLDFAIAVVNAIGEISKDEAITALQREWSTLAAPPEGWQDIASAPKDGRMLLLYPSSCWTEDTEFDYEVSYWDEDLGRFAQSAHPDDFDGYTHWMMLPSEPNSYFPPTKVKP